MGLGQDKTRVVLGGLFAHQTLITGHGDHNRIRQRGADAVGPLGRIRKHLGEVRSKVRVVLTVLRIGLG